MVPLRIYSLTHSSLVWKYPPTYSGSVLSRIVITVFHALMHTHHIIGHQCCSFDHVSCDGSTTVSWNGPSINRDVPAPMLLFFKQVSACNGSWARDACCTCSWLSLSRRPSSSSVKQVRLQALCVRWFTYVTSKPVKFTLVHVHLKFLSQTSSLA